MPTINKTKLDIKIEDDDGSSPVKLARLGGDQIDSDIVDEQVSGNDKESLYKTT